jgi:hypothetical protein
VITKGWSICNSHACGERRPDEITPVRSRQICYQEDEIVSRRAMCRRRETANISVKVRVYDRAQQQFEFCTDVGRAFGPGSIEPEMWRAVAGTITIESSPPRARALRERDHHVDQRGVAQLDWHDRANHATSQADGQRRGGLRMNATTMRDLLRGNGATLNSLRLRRLDHCER